MTKYIQIQTTFDKREAAEKLAGLMLGAKLISCGQISEIESLYNWDSKRCKEKEFLLTMKTRVSLFAECEKFIKVNHPYKCPQIIALSIVAGGGDYLKWIEENTKEDKA